MNILFPILKDAGPLPQNREFALFNSVTVHFVVIVVSTVTNRRHYFQSKVINLFTWSMDVIVEQEGREKSLFSFMRTFSFLSYRRESPWILGKLWDLVSR